ncbi:MAG: helix-turn-helix transcriptional regulator [Sutterellaceae bacterium]|nr:helix-turn-helix transcriptional regulator [Sutterellaceae bacterium]
MDEGTAIENGWRQFAKDFDVGGERPEHMHDDAQLLYANRGVMLVKTQGRQRIIAPFQALWIPAGVAHSIRFLTDTCMRSLYFPMEATKFKRLKAQVRLVAMPALLRELIAAIFESESDKATLNLMTQLVFRLIEQGKELTVTIPLTDDAPLARLMTEILAKRLWDMSLADAAAKLNLTPKTFSRHFKNSVSMSYRDWMVRAKLLTALDLLAGGMSIKQTAFALGYGESATFIAAFKRLFGVTPGNVSGNGRN